jgi:hypothetical protein
MLRPLPTTIAAPRPPAKPRGMEGKPASRRRRGQSLVEFALVLPVMLMVIMFGVDFGRAFLGWVNLQNATRLGANYASLHPDANWASASDPDRIKYTALINNDVGTTNCPLTAVTLPTFSGTTIGSNTSVSLSCNFRFLTPFISNFWPGGMQMSASSVFHVRTGTYANTAPPPSVAPSPSPSPVPSPSPSPNPSPSVSPSPSPSPSPTPPPCTVPNLINLYTSQVQTAWTNQNFTTTVIISRPPNGDYKVGSQSITAGQQPGCNSVITVTH